MRSSSQEGQVSDDSVVVNPDGTLANVFVYVKSGLEGKAFETPERPITIDQNGCLFKPRILGIQTGQTLKVTNSDPVTHNIHPLAQVESRVEPQPVARRPAACAAFCSSGNHDSGEMQYPSLDARLYRCRGSSLFRGHGHGRFLRDQASPARRLYDRRLAGKDGSQEQQVVLPPSGTADVAFTFKGE